MARLTRKNIKVFAENATNNGVFGSLQAGNPVTTTNVEQVQSLPAWSTGWDSATMTSEKLPPLEEFQGVQYVTTYQQAYLMQEGIPEWASTVTYYKGCLAKEVTANGFRIYNSLTNNNKNHSLSDTSNWKKVMDSDDLYAFDNNVVHKTGDETISGTKTFQGTGWITYIKNTSVTYNTTPSSDTMTTIAFVDKNSQNMGIVECARAADNATLMRLNVQGANGSWASQPLQLRVDANGNSYAYAPTPTDTTTTGGEQIATTGWVNSANNNVVHKTGNETITGAKTFVGTGHIVLQNPDVTYNTAPSTKTYTAMYITDKNGHDIGCIENVRYTTGETETCLQVSGETGSYGSRLALGMLPNGTNYTYCPASDRNGSIVTTTGISKTPNGFVKFGNGLIIQWGYSKVDGSQVTLPTPFTTTNYRICATYMKASGSLGSGYGHVVTYPTSTTSFYANTEAGEYQWIAIGY